MKFGTRTVICSWSVWTVPWSDAPGPDKVWTFVGGDTVEAAA